MRVVPVAFGAGALLHLVEFLLLRSAADGVRAVVITIVYLHLVGFGAILLSGFWSIANEYFDPREAKLRFGRIAGAGTIGGVAGGLMAERTAAMFGVDAVLVLLTVPSFRNRPCALADSAGPAGLQSPAPGRTRLAGRARRLSPGAVPGQPGCTGPAGDHERRAAGLSLQKRRRRGIRQRARTHPLFRSFLHRESGVNLRGPGLCDPDCPAPAWLGKDRPMASRGRGVRRHRIAVWSQGGYGSAGSRTGIGAARFIPSLRVRVVLHARATA